MEKFLADVPAPPAPIAVNAMADADDAAEAFEIEVQQIADVRPLVPLHRAARLDQRHPIQAGARQHARDGRARHAAARR